ncbi:MAG TPA: toll/interleukin-1 receptor domain-containing protein [Streptosporangiaceae bacterium]|jgi:hypothetical protein
MSGDYDVHGHAFLSYARVDAEAVDGLQRILRAAGVRVWRDTGELWPGQDWKSLIRRAINDEALAFIACFSSRSVSRVKGYQNEELMLAIEQVRLRQPGDSWLIPVRFDDCVIPPLDIGGGRTFDSIQGVDLFGDRWGEGIARLVAVALRLLGRPSPEVAEPVLAGPAVTQRWRLTHSSTDVPNLPELARCGFNHPAYSRPIDRTPPCVRIRAVVACETLSESHGWQQLRISFTDLLTQEPVMRLIGELTDITGDARWHPRGTQHKTFLEADLTADEEAARPLASASLTLSPRPSAGRLPGRAVLTLHVDFVRRTPITISGQITFKRPSYWLARFTEALELPDILAHWLKDELNLAAFDRPPAEFGIMLQDMAPITSMVDAKGIPALQGPPVQNQFTGWALADMNGQTVTMLASAMMLDLSERVLHLNGTAEEMEGRV